MLSLCIEQYSICQTIISFLDSIGPAFWDSLSPFQLKAKQPQIHLNFVLRILLFLITQAELSIHKTWNERLCTLHFWKLYSDKSLRRTLYYTWNAECRCWLRQRVVQRALLAKQTKGSLGKIHGSKVEAKILLSRQHALDWLCARAVDAKINFDRLGGQKVAGTKLAWEKKVWGGLDARLSRWKKSGKRQNWAQKGWRDPMLDWLGPKKCPMLRLCAACTQPLHFSWTVPLSCNTAPCCTALHCTTALYIVLVNIDHCTLHSCFHSVQ